MPDTYLSGERRPFSFRGHIHRRLSVFFCLLCFVLGVAAQESSPSIKGVVLDSVGSAVVDAEVEFKSDSGTRSTRTDAQGTFVIARVNESGNLTITSNGFAPVTMAITRDRLSALLEVRLHPAPLLERLNVSEGDSSFIRTVPASQFSIDRAQVERSGSLTLDDLLRQVPGFSLFRRSGSLTANPTSQGVSLRGVGANGASRAVVLLDGIPLNSPFGGWVYWSRVPRVAIDELNVVNGAASDLYGSGALGGVVNISTRRSGASFVRTEISYGNLNTPDVSLDAGRKIGSWGVTVSGQGFKTDGYILVPEDERGRVDTPATTSDLTGELTVTKKFGEQRQVFVRGSSFGESRNNGTRLQVNDTRMANADVGLDWSNASTGDFSFRLFGSKELFNQNFTAIAIDRNAESLTNRQRNPSSQVGLIGQWRKVGFTNHALSAGLEMRYIRGHSAEKTFAASRPTANVDSGGRQDLVGLFGQDTFQLKHDFVVTLGGRFDWWNNTKGFANRFPTGLGQSTQTFFVDRQESSFSPRIAVLHSFGKNISISGSAYHAFRAPTLNELYRGFRVGNVQTNANAELNAERLTGAEGGLSLQRWSDRITFRGIGFWNLIKDPITNVTLVTTPVLITRQRQNLGSLQARGLELSLQIEAPHHLHFATEYLLTDSTVHESPGIPALKGLRVPQVPRNQINFQVSYATSLWSASVQGRFVGKQFEDDLNTLPLASFATFDAEASRRAIKHTTIFLAVQNFTNVRYVVGRTPATTLGPPLLFRLGLRSNSR